MRVQAIFAVMLVLVTSVLGVCPACDRAHLADSATQSVNLPASEHACCERLKTSDDGTNPVPENDSNLPAPQCSHEAASLMLEAASPDHAVVLDMAATALPSFVVLAEFVPVAGVEEWRAAMDPSPPPLLALPIRI